MLNIVGRLVSVATGDILGYKIQGSTPYTAVMTVEKAKELGIEDASIAQYLECDNIEVVEIPNNRYALISNSSSFIEEFAESYREDMFGKEVYYGYIFEPMFICPIDSEEAIQRLLQIEKGLIL